MDESKSVAYHDVFYSFDFPLYLCMTPHFHGFFRWLGGEKGHVRVMFPQICNKYGKIIGHADKNNVYAESELMTITCPHCKFIWEELNILYRNETYCPRCSLSRIELKDFR